MTEHNLLQEMALNRREIKHDVWGSFIISRPTNKVLAKIETAKTRSLNKDLQSTIMVEAGDEVKEVPAILTRKSKEKLLRLHQEWTDEDDVEMRETADAYQKVCFELDDAGFTGVDFLTKDYEEIHEKLKVKLGKKYEENKPKLQIVIPTLAEEKQPEETEEAVIKSFVTAKAELENVLKDLSLSDDFNRLDELHKQYRLYLQGIVAQTKLYMIKLKEITLFSDTVEARAEKEGQLVKIVECTKNLDKSPVWTSVDECQESTQDKLSWVLGQLERFEQLDPTEDIVDERVRNRFNFLFPLGAMSIWSGESDAQRESKEDGESQENTPSNSIEDLGTTESN